LINAPAHLGRDHDRHLGVFGAETADQPLAAAVAVDVGGVEERDAGIDRRIHRRQRDAVVGLAPAATDRPRTEPDLGHVAPGLP
jgi:hypothetical protein